MEARRAETRLRGSVRSTTARPRRGSPLSPRVDWRVWTGGSEACLGRIRSRARQVVVPQTVAGRGAIRACRCPRSPCVPRPGGFDTARLRSGGRTRRRRRGRRRGSGRPRHGRRRNRPGSPHGPPVAVHPHRVERLLRLGRETLKDEFSNAFAQGSQGEHPTSEQGPGPRQSPPLDLERRCPSGRSRCRGGSPERR